MARIAVVGAGVAGLVSAYYLSKRHHVDMYDGDSRLGGHTHTVSVNEPSGNSVRVDTGFIVFNETNYPHFLQFLADLNVDYQSSDMSFSYTSDDQRLYWGSDFPTGIFAQRRRWCDPRFYQFLLGVHRFNRACLRDFEQGLSDQLTLGDYLQQRSVSDSVIRYYVLPMTSAIWSASLSDSLNFPLASFVRFWKNHQLLEIGKGLPWKTITHGSKSYIDRVVPSISGHIRQSTPVCGIDDLGDSIRVTTASDALHYDGVVVATHADTALHLLTHPSPAHRRLLGAWHYSTNRTVLHTDPVVMPPRRSAWCSWNVRDFRAGITTAAAGVTYWMNRLQSLKSATDYFVTLNDCDAIRPDRIIRDMVYTHPIMNRESMATQTELPQLNRQSRVVCCGSYFGYGFHEDAVRSAIHAISELEATLR